MKLNLRLPKAKILNNLEFVFVLLLIVISIGITLLYNTYKSNYQKQYIELLNNLYFKKTIENVFNNLSPKYINIDHRVVKNETLSNIFKSYNIPDKEANLLINNLNKINKNNTLKINQKIIFTIDKSNNKIVKLIYPVSQTKRIKIIRSSNEDNFEISEQVTNLKKK